jgi:hypothetical protein
MGDAQNTGNWDEAIHWARIGLIILKGISNSGSEDALNWKC